MCLKTRKRLYFQEITFEICRIILFQYLAIILYGSLKIKTKRYFKTATCGIKSAHYGKYYNLCIYNVRSSGRIRLVLPGILHPYDLWMTEKD